MAEVVVTNKKGYLGDTVTQMYIEKKGILECLVKLTGKHLCESLSLAGRDETLLKKGLLDRFFPIKFIRTTFS